MIIESETDDTWPERCGLPTLGHALVQIEFVTGCLGEEARQETAAQHLRRARESVKLAMTALQQESR